SARQEGASEVSDPLKAILDAADEDFTAPNRPIVAVTRAVETDADDALAPLAALGENRSDVGAVMLDASPFGFDEALRVRCRDVLRMAIVRHQQVAPIELVHEHQVVDRLLKSPKGLIVAQVADVLAHERLAVNHQSDRV